VEETPSVTRIYQNHHLDSTRWDVIVPRDDDVVITTSYKSGTTWAQQIMLELLYGQVEPRPEIMAISPWPDARFLGISREDLVAQAESIEGRRFFKSHLPLDGLPYHPQLKYLIVARDPRDVFMSFFNHYHNYTDVAYATLNAPDIVGPPLPRCPDDPRELWQGWITKGWFEWESEGYPFWSNLHHTQTYWDYRHLPNFLLLHYNDMLKDLDGAVRKISAFCDIAASDEEIAKVVEAATFSNVKKKVAEIPEESDPRKIFFRGGTRAFFFKGSNERWREVLGEADLALYEEAKVRVLSPACARWLEKGGAIDPVDG
jgi:aryl sulfotransferase